MHDKILEPIGGSSYLGCYEDSEENITKLGTQTLQTNIHEKCGGYYKEHISLHTIMRKSMGSE